MQDTQLDPWVRKISLEKEKATHSSILAWRILWTEEPCYSPQGGKESDTTERLCITYIRKARRKRGERDREDSMKNRKSEKETEQQRKTQ